MQVQDTRLASFAAILKPKTRAKPAFPLSPFTHPHLTPQNLAEAGFYHSTSQAAADLPDTCRCFRCDVALGGWDKGDDPFEEHLKRGGCAWAELVCWLKVDGRKHPDGGRKRTVYPNAESLPSSSQSAALREQTFGKDGKSWWPHKKKSWLPTVSALANAGFIYTPTVSDKDNATCPLCQYSVEGWEEKDDPLEIHQNKFPQCPFFTATVDPSYGVQAEPTSKASRSTKSQDSKKSKRATTVPIAEPTPPTQPDPKDPVTEEEVLVVSPKVVIKPRATTAESSKSKGRGRRKVAEAQPEVTEEVYDVESAIASEIDVAEEVEEVKEVDGKPARQIKGRPAKGRGKTQVEKEHVDDRRVTIKPRSAPSRTRPPPPDSEPRPLSQLERFANVPPSSPAPSLRTPPKSRATALPRAILDSSVQDGAMLARSVIEDLAKDEEALRTPLSDDQKGMTLEELVRSEMRRRYEAMEREGEALIGKWEERTRESRSRIESV